MERKAYRALNFDLDTNIMKSLGVYPNGYDGIKRSMKKNGFSHRQGSGYLSIEPMLFREVMDAIDNVTFDNPWLQCCVKKLDVTSVSKQAFDLALHILTLQIPDDYKNNQKGKDDGRSK